MKKTTSLLLAVLLVLGSLAGCAKPVENKPAEPDPAPAGDTQTPDAPAQEPPADPVPDTPEVTPAADETPDGAFSPDGSVIFEKDGVKITTAGLGVDPTDTKEPPIIWIDVENTSDNDAYLGVIDGVVNGFTCTALIINLYEEDGSYYGGSYDFGVTAPANSTNRYALGFSPINIPGTQMNTISELTLSFTTSPDEYSWHDYVSEPVTIVTGEEAPEVDIKSLGTVAIDNDELTLVFGDQDYSDWFGPEIYFYVENKTDTFIYLTPESGETDGTPCDYIYGGTIVNPGAKAVSFMMFENESQKLKSIENLTVSFNLAKNSKSDDITYAGSVLLDPVSVTYPPQVWGEYENAGIRFDVKPKYNDLITVEVPENDPDGVLFSVYETESLEAGTFEGAGWLFGIRKVSESTVHQLLRGEMSGMTPFAKDAEGNYYIYTHPTDVRLERANPEDMQAAFEQWSMLNEWADTVTSVIVDDNGLEHFTRSNTIVDVLLARAAWEDGVSFTLTGPEYGTVSGDGFNSAPYVDFLMEQLFYETEGDAPDGDYISLSFKNEDARLDFFLAPGGYVRYVSGNNEQLYQVFWEEDYLPASGIVEGWYEALCENAGLKGPDTSLNPFVGIWYEEIAGRGEVTIERSLVPGKAIISVSWPESAAVMDHWSMVAQLSDGALTYEGGQYESIEIDEEGEEWTIDSDYELTGSFTLEGTTLKWQDSRSEGSDPSSFIK